MWQNNNRTFTSKKHDKYDFFLFRGFSLAKLGKEKDDTEGAEHVLAAAQ